MTPEVQAALIGAVALLLVALLKLGLNQSRSEKLSESQHNDVVKWLRAIATSTSTSCALSKVASEKISGYGHALERNHSDLRGKIQDECSKQTGQHVLLTKLVEDKHKDLKERIDKIEGMFK